MKTVMWIMACAALALGLGGQAMAQVSQQGGPVLVSGDSWHADDTAHTQIWDGRVEVIQADSRLRADHVVITHAPGGTGDNRGFGEVVKIEATGNVYYVTPETTAKGDTAVYTKSDDTMILSGDVVVQQQKNVMTGTRLVSQVKAGITTMEAAPGGPTKARVRAVIYPDENKAAKAAGN